MAAVKRLDSPTKRVARLAGAMRRQGSCWDGARCQDGATGSARASQQGSFYVVPPCLPALTPSLRLAARVRSAQFMARLQHDLATRETRLQELQHK